MARRSSSNDSGGCIGCFAILMIIGLISSIVSFVVDSVSKTWPYILLVGGCVIGIYLLVKLYKGLDNQRIDTPVINKTKKDIVDSKSIDLNVDVEIDRQIKKLLVKRKDYKKDIIWNKIKKFKYIMPWNKSDLKSREEQKIKDDIALLEGKYNASVYRFKDNSTSDFERLRNAFVDLKKIDTKTYDNTPSNSNLIIDYNPIGDMQFVKFAVQPICLSLSGNIFCIIPHYIVRFSSSGAYIKTYNSHALKAGIVNGTYSERVRHVTWAHTNMNGMPDRRYKNNPQRVYYTNVTHTVWNMLALGIAEFQLKYEINDNVKNSLIYSIRSYSSMVHKRTYDSVFHLLRLLNTCETNNANIKNIMDEIGYQDNLVG